MTPPNAIFLTLFSLVLFGGLIALIWWLSRTKHESQNQLQEFLKQVMESQKQDQSIQLLHREINTLREQLGQSMEKSAKLIVESQKSVGERLDRAAQVVGNVQKSLGSLDQATKQVHEVGKDISQLQEILRAPKMRGAFGELFLSDLLAQILPGKNFTLQHQFKTGDIVDAVIRLGRLVPVDAKFPLENFKRLVDDQDPQDRTVARRKFITDVKRHIDVIAKKYILPDEHTFDFALMYIPAENVYYETIIKDDNASEESLLTYAFSKHVVPVSPNSFYAYLHTISLGLRGMKIEENARVIMNQLSRLRGDFGRFREDFNLIGKHLSNTRTKYEDADKRLNRFDDKLSVTSGHSTENPKELETDSTPSKSLLN